VYREKEEKHFASNELSYKEAEELLKALLKAYDSTILVLDALDECNPRDKGRLNLVNYFRKLLEGGHNLKILIASRSAEDYAYRLKDDTNIEIGAADNIEDIRKYIRSSIEKDKDKESREKPLSDELVQEIIETLTEKSQGM